MVKGYGKKGSFFFGKGTSKGYGKEGKKGMIKGYGKARYGYGYE